MSHLEELFSLYAPLPAIKTKTSVISYAELGELVKKRKDVPPKSDSFSVIDLLTLWSQGITAFPLNPRLPQSIRDSLEYIPSVATLLCTSGTTGVPKIAAHSLDNYFASAYASAAALNLGPGCSWNLSLPLYHVSGLSIVFRCLVSGAALAIDTEATHYSFVPTQLFRILSDPTPYKHASSILLGGAPLSQTLIDKANAAGLPVRTSWGMTETTAMAILDGNPLPHIEITLANDGEILVKGPSLFQGYLEKGTITRPNGWFHTKDLGAYENGKLIWRGRKDFLFISGGENIQPEEIEQALCQLPHIIDAIVVPVQNPEFGSLPAAFISSQTSIDGERIKGLLLEVLPKFKIPRWYFPFPDDTSLKPNSFQLMKVAQDILAALGE